MISAGLVKAGVACEMKPVSLRRTVPGVRQGRAAQIAQCMMCERAAVRINGDAEDAQAELGDGRCWWQRRPWLW